MGPTWVVEMAAGQLPRQGLNQVNPTRPQSDLWGQSRAKAFLAERAAAHMTKQMLAEVDPSGDVIGWFTAMKSLIP